MKRIIQMGSCLRCEIDMNRFRHEDAILGKNLKANAIGGN